MSATATATQTAAIEMRKGFDSVHITLDPNPAADLGWDVTGTGIYNTSRGGMVGDTKTRTFPTETAARDYANGWFANLRGKGYVRVA